MVSQCANPACGAQFLYFGEGQLITVRHPVHNHTESSVEFFWLCGTCATEMTFEISPDGGVNLVPRPVHNRSEHHQMVEVGYDVR